MGKAILAFVGCLVASIVSLLIVLSLRRKDVTPLPIEETPCNDTICEMMRCFVIGDNLFGSCTEGEYEYRSGGWQLMWNRERSLQYGVTNKNGRFLVLN